MAAPPLRATSGLMHRSKRYVMRLLDHLVGECEQLVWHIEAKRLRAPQIDHELELGRLHHGQVCGLLALENSSGVDADLTISIGNARPVAHQTARGDKL